MQRISEDEALTFGIEAKHDLMDNGERRFRLICSADGSSYCRTSASEQGGWQNSHYHKSVSELYVVQSGWMAYAEKTDAGLRVAVLKEGESITFKPFEQHNIYLSPLSVIHTIKYGEAMEKDWFASLELDRLTLQLDPADFVPLT